MGEAIVYRWMSLEGQKGGTWRRSETKKEWENLNDVPLGISLMLMVKDVPLGIWLSNLCYNNFVFDY